MHLPWAQGRGRTRLCPLSPCAKWKHLLRNSAQLPAPHPRGPSAAGPRQAAQPPSALSLPRGSARSVRPSPAISRGWCAETPAALPRLLNNPHTCAPGGCRPRAGGPSCWARARARARAGLLRRIPVPPARGAKSWAPWRGRRREHSASCVLGVPSPARRSQEVEYRVPGPWPARCECDCAWRGLAAALTALLPDGGSSGCARLPVAPAGTGAATPLRRRVEWKRQRSRGSAMRAGGCDASAGAALCARVAGAGAQSPRRGRPGGPGRTSAGGARAPERRRASPEESPGMRGPRRARPGGCSRGGEGGRAVLMCGAGFVTCLRVVRGWRRPL